MKRRVTKLNNYEKNENLKNPRKSYENESRLALVATLKTRISLFQQFNWR
jgi:hypothetical protein